MAKTAVAEPLDRLIQKRSVRSFQGRNLLQIAMPLGGIGTGCICLNGQGGLQDFSIRNKPATSAMPDGHITTDSAFALLHLPGLEVTRLVEGPLPFERVFNQGLKGQGYREGGFEGLPRFRNGSFKGEFPFGMAALSDPEVPLTVKLTGFNPFIPLDDKDSGIPCAILEYTLSNPGAASVDYEFSYHLSHLAPGKDANNAPKSRNAPIPGLGAYLYNEEHPNSAAYGSAALGVLGHEPAIKAMWFRGGWFDGISALWREVSTGSFKPNSGEKAATSQGRNGASILLKGSLAPGAEVTYPIVIAWYFPNVDYAHGENDPHSDVSEAPCDCGGLCDCSDQAAPRWRPYYASQWKDAREVLIYVRDHFTRLRERTQAFKDALFRSTVPAYALDAVSANLAIIKSPTILRQENGNIWAWEGCFCDSGCCHGSCTHVWNYAQALPHLFPQLERTLREKELERSMDENGHVTFRSALPDGPAPHTFHAASDGQLGGIMKVYREWQIYGQRDWLLKMYPLAKKSMDFCIENWDPRHTGLLEEPHHNTYDIEFWGPDGMCTSFYLGALTAMSALGRDSGHPEDAATYQAIAQKGAAAMESALFNGEYYQQKVMLEGLRASPSPETLERLAEANPDEAELLKSEGPKYQYGTGCISDGVFGAWLASLCGLESPQDPVHIRKNLQSIFNYNFKTSLWDHANLQRPGYAIGDEPGLLLCTWPKGGKPTLPFVYSDEVWTGIEYQAASHMISQGLAAEGLTIVKALRSRYDGRVRNPWNEYECGNFYARAMASYALLIALSGFRYSAVSKTLYLAPRLEARPFECFFSTASGWGTIVVKEDRVILKLQEGILVVDQLRLNSAGKSYQVAPRVTARAGKATVVRLINNH